jgi:hypothetical protein
MCSPEALARGRAALARLTEGCHLLARFGPSRFSGSMGGRQWERWVAHDLLPRGALVAQGPGKLHLFGLPAASGLANEFDGASGSWWGTVIVECKAYQCGGPSKEDLCVYDRKTWDACVARRRAGITSPHWRVLVSSGPVHPSVRRYCCLYGIVLSDSQRLPLPLLLEYATLPFADAVGDPVLWSELVRLGESAVIPFEGCYVPHGRQLVFDLERMPDPHLNDLLFVQESLTEEILGWVEEQEPEYFSDRAALLLAGIGATAPLVA